MSRNYVGIDMSEDYVENTKKRLEELKNQHFNHLFFNLLEFNEMKRLLIDMAMPAKKIANDKNLLKLFTNQFSLRMKKPKQYDRETIETVLKDLTD